MASIILKNGREESLRRHHPWIFSGAIQNVRGAINQPGETVDVISKDGEWLAYGAYSPSSQIRIRAWSFDRNEKISPEFFHSRFERGIKARHLWLSQRTISAYRLINSESDGLPGLIVDRYGDFLVCQFLSAGTEYWKKEIVSALGSLLPVAGIYERSDVDIRLKEGLELRAGVLSGQNPPEFIEIQEGSSRFLVDIVRGHKTGFYLDQGENRALITQYSMDSDVLNCFSYTGAFGIWALKGGAKKVTNIDTSCDALEIARKNIELNSLNSEHVENREEDVFKLLRKYRDSAQQFNLIILDPPKFAESASQLDGASRGYKDINLLAFKLLRPGGVLCTFSCSGHITPDLFQKIVADAALDACRNVQITDRLGQRWDHPVSLNFPEGSYLKGLVCRVW